MSLEENKRVDLVTHLRRKNFKVTGKPQSDDSRVISIPAFGLCSYAAAYCGTEDLIPEVAEALVELQGVDFVVFRDEGGVVLRSSQGTARIECKNRDAFRYLATSGDPLDLRASVQSLTTEGKMDDRGFASSADWFEKTNSHRYPNAVVNIYSSLCSPRVQNTADVLVSMKDGYYYGWSPFGKFVRLAATHGNALAGSSNAFLMSTHRNLPECVRADDAKQWLKG
jgi:hypothetical protein